MDTGGFFDGVKRPGREADNSVPTSAEVKKTWIYTSTPPKSSWRSASLIKHKDKFTLYIYIYKTLDCTQFI
jgi:hypothetical protein